jgi:hypothetical protein
MPPFARTAASGAPLGSPAAACPSLEWMEAPHLGEANFSFHNGLSDPSMSARAGGVFYPQDCGLGGEELAEYRVDGLIHVGPSLLDHWNGEAGSLVIDATFTERPLLVVHDHEGGWHLDDGLANDPFILLTAPPVVDYAIFIGTHGTTRLSRPGTLIISETTP